MDVTLEPLVDMAPAATALPATALSCGAAAGHGEATASSLPPPANEHHASGGGNAATAAVADSSSMVGVDQHLHQRLDLDQDQDGGLVLGQRVVVDDAPGCGEDNIVRALAFAEEQQHPTAPPPPADSGSGSGSNSGAPPSASSTDTEGFAARLGHLAVNGNGNGGVAGGESTAEDKGDGRVNKGGGRGGGAGAGSSGLDDNSDADVDVGSADEDSEDYTWFSSERRTSAGERKHGRGRPRGERVYDRVRINDNAEVRAGCKTPKTPGSAQLILSFCRSGYWYRCRNVRRYRRRKFVPKCGPVVS